MCKCNTVMTLRIMILFILFQTFTLVSTEYEMAIKFLYLYEFKSMYFNIYSKCNPVKGRGREKNYNSDIRKLYSIGIICINIKYL